jgi:hypothetical protein
MPTYYDIGPIPSENVTDFHGVEDSYHPAMLVFQLSIVYPFGVIDV